eukprot:TRINITY_DN1338_c0_g1_i1.p1 TRINITY_DN1338_c0_g1~~TRINITY_DN1338_c0_g1_i1.p1  ORF type:complete len:153 (+),score=23.30 TRINITY_DN1338_c0_g1_i1:33-461(+)
MSLGRQLYKELIWTARDYPGGVDVIRRKAREHWLRNREVTDPDQLEKLYSHARFVIKELEALDRLKKYRFLKQKSQGDSFSFLFCSGRFGHVWHPATPTQRSLTWTSTTSRTLQLTLPPAPTSPAQTDSALAFRRKKVETRG